MSVKGRDLLHGVPREIEISQGDIAGPLNDLTNQIVEAVILTLTRTEPELAADIHENGIVLTGGGSLLTGIDEVLSAAVGLSVTVAENALLSVAIGAGRALENSIYSQAMAER
jgi:rod shape-determining protein MreB